MSIYWLINLFTSFLGIQTFFLEFTDNRRISKRSKSMMLETISREIADFERILRLIKMKPYLIYWESLLLPRPSTKAPPITENIKISWKTQRTLLTFIIVIERKRASFCRKEIEYKTLYKSEIVALNNVASFLQNVTYDYTRWSLRQNNFTTLVLF